MNPILMRHVESTDESFKVWTNANPYIHNPWHYHPECEITFIYDGTGVLFVGDKVTRYEKNHLILVGPNLPHEYRSSVKDTPDYLSKSIAVHFRNDFPGNDFFKIPEAKVIYDILEKSKRGIQFNDPVVQKRVKDKMLCILKTKGIERVNILFSILETIAYSSNQEYLSSQSFVDSIDEGHDERMNNIYKYVMAHFKDQISIDQVAREANMTNSSFCRFFKKRANQSFVHYLNSIRIGFACKLLYTESYNISEVAYESGFENISNFNKQFLRIKKITPSQFLSQFAKTGK